MGKNGPKPIKAYRDAIIAASALAEQWSGIHPTSASEIRRTMDNNLSSHYAPHATPSLPTILKITADLEESGFMRSGNATYGTKRNLITYTPTEAGLRSLEGTSLADTITTQTNNWTGQPSPSSTLFKKD